MEYRFEILFVYLQRSAVIARQLCIEPFSLDRASTLDGRVVTGLDMPRKVDEDGRQRMALKCSR